MHEITRTYNSNIQEEKYWRNYKTCYIVLHKQMKLIAIYNGGMNCTCLDKMWQKYIKDSQLPGQRSTYIPLPVVWGNKKLISIYKQLLKTIPIFIHVCRRNSCIPWPLLRMWLCHRTWRCQLCIRDRTNWTNLLQISWWGFSTSWRAWMGTLNTVYFNILK